MTETDSLFDDDWRTALLTAVNEDDAFAQAAEQFDGSVAFEIGDRSAWFKVYRGEMIDTERYVPMFGATFRLVGSRDAWDALARGEVSLSEALYDGSLRMAGNKLEANRMRDMLELVVRQLQALEPEVAAGD